MPGVARSLDRYRVAHLATADSRGRPHVVPICFTVTDRTLYSVIDAKPKRRPPMGLRRVSNILANPRAAVVIDSYSEDWHALGYVLMEGAARLLKDGPEHAAALRLLRAKYPQYGRMVLEDHPVIAIDVTRLVPWGRVL